MEKVSLIATVFNERPGLRAWWELMKQQTRQPDEIVVCDGGSNDGTLDELQAYARDNPAPPLRVVSKPGANIAAGRNAAIAAAAGELIVVTDVGAQPRPEWLAEILKPFETDPDTQAVAGYYRFLQDTRFRKAAAAYLGRPWESDTYTPSSRSIAFRKEVWQKVGGYPEWLTQAAEDTLFNRMLTRENVRWRKAPEAIVVWNMRPRLGAFLSMIARNAFGDAEAGTGRQAFQRTMLKLELALCAFAGIALAGALYRSVWLGVFCGVWALVSVLIARAFVRRVPLSSCPEFFLLSLLGGPAYVWGYARGKHSGKARP